MKPQKKAESLSAGSLEAVDLEVGYDRDPIIKGLSFVAEPGLFHTILGPNGSGKSTLLKALTGELSYSGRITLNGESLSTIRAESLALRRGVLPQHTVLAFPLTVAEVVSLGVLRNDTVGTATQRRNRIIDALGMVDLAGFENRQYQSLSGGEQQRVQLARVLCQVWCPIAEDGSRRWLFLDEPVSSLDIKHQIQIMNIAADYARRGGGVLAVMHDLNLTASFADTVMVIRNGELKIMGSVAAVYKDEILSDAYDYDVQVSQVDGRSAPIVLARHG
ncbi:heme ABC transporter ATP-binding protein [Labrenzia sp. CE80]|uniref:heme ABC transporter ATP-binding protein n=1 Tax=Labrenzia sp. CE80 TaxID=1788986 RepID=UPI00129AA179|nr:heme ABC transporter ATP-binding protein [Labrenzia sp. CE80]